MTGTNSAENVVLESRDGAVVTLTLNRPKRLNALDGELMEALVARLRGAARDGSVRAVVITGAGRGFCAGGDLRALRDAKLPRRGDAFHALASTFHQAVSEIRWMEKPVIAAVNGVAGGGGFSLALACDLRVMAASATLHQSYTSAGLVFDGGKPFTLPRIVGLAKALELAALDEPIGAEEALRLGLATKVVPDAAIAAEAALFAKKLAGRAVKTIGAAKRLLNESWGRGLEAQMEAERHAITASADSPEGREGMDAFLDKREPKFEGGV